MNQEIKDILKSRAIIVANLDAIIKSSSKNKTSQLSLFGDSSRDNISLTIPNAINYEEMLEKESSLLGVALTYNTQDSFILFSKRFCNTTLRDINELTESKKKLLFIAKIKSIDNKTSKSGNKYAKITFKDYDSECSMFLFSENYRELIKNVFLNKYYLCECSYDADKGSTIISRLKQIDDIEIDQYVSTIILEVKADASSPKNIELLRDYIWKNMISNKFNLIFSYKGKEFPAPYKIKLDSEDYTTIKPWINNILVKK